MTQQDCYRGNLAAVSLVTDAPGEYVVKVRPQGETVTGDYQISLAEFREENPDDRHRIAAYALVIEARRLAGLESAASLQAAIKKYEMASNAWEIIGDRRELASTLRSMGVLYHSLGLPKDALRAYQQAQKISQSLNDLESEAEAFDGIGYSYLTMGNNDQAWDNCLKALEMNRQSGNRRGIAQSLNDLGEIRYDSSKLQQSLNYYQQAIALWRELADDQGQARTLLNFGYTYSDLGEPGKALEFDHQALTFWKAINSNRGQALTLTAIGRLKSRLGENEEAIRYFNQAMPLARLVGDQTEEARILNGLGFVQESLGQPKKAIEYYNQALRLFQAVSYRNGEATTYHEIGRAYYSLGDMRHSLDYFQQCYEMSLSLSDKRMQSYALRGMGMVYDNEGNKTKALEAYQEALPIFKKEKDRRGEAVTRNLIGRIYHSQGRFQAAIEHYKQALALNQAAEDRNRESLTLYNLACAERDRGQLAAALSQIETSLKIVESLRTKVASRELRTSYFATIQQYYQLDIDLLMQSQKQTSTNQFWAKALEVNERGRARSFLDLLGENRIDVQGNAESALVQHLRRLQTELGARIESRIQLLSDNAPQNEVAEVTREIEALTDERRGIEAQIRLANPHYAALTQPQPLSAWEIQQLLNRETVLLEYSLGDKRSYVWVVTPTEVKAYELAERARIEQVAQEVYRILAPDDSAPVQLDKQRVELFREKATQLSQLILAPFAEELGQKRLVVVADGILQYIPFSVLPKPDGGRLNDSKISVGKSAAETHAAVPLITDHEIVNLPSASTLAVLRHETAERKKAPKTVAVLADPVFDAEDMRLISLNRQKDFRLANQNLALALSAGLSLKRGEGFKRLHGTLREAEAIEELTSSAERLVAKDFDANLALATSPELSRYQIIHFATHGVLDRNTPEYSALVFSLFDRNGRPQPGHLRLQQVYNLNLPAELIVLSACDTGLGKEFKGEGLVGLTRGFMYAGAPRVMASLWKVDDEPTAMLMRHFYRHLLKGRKSPAAALRAAQVALSEDPEWNAPFYWGSFVLQGEWQ
ncbi:MAG: CHAT domain-containing protein [Acidobacteria bacterium]|nr:CHAT domain-containing protein [Acidobacteriota bacterium]